MKYELKKIEQSAVEVKISIDKSELSPMKDAMVSKIASEVEIPGFRKGNAPASAILSQYKDQIKEEIAQELINKHFPEIVAEEKISPISYANMTESNLTEEEFDVTFQIDVYPEVELGEYKGLEVEKGSFELTDDMLNTEIEFMLNSKTTLEEVTEEGYKAELGDTVNLAFEGSIDGVLFDGGKSESHELKLGSKSFIDTFEDQLVGYTVGQEGEVNVNFPVEYHSEALAGKPAVFKVKINSIKKEIKPELNDELAKELGFESVEDLRTKKAEEIKKAEETKIENEYLGALIAKIAENTKVEIPKSMVAQEVENRIREFEQQLSMQGIALDTYLKMTGATIEALQEQILPLATGRVKNDLILEAIAKAENLDASEEEISVKMSEVAASYGMELAKMEEELNKHNNLDNFKYSLKADVLMKKAIDVVVDNAK